MTRDQAIDKIRDGVMKRRSPKQVALDDFQKLRRMECADADGMVSCISCGKHLPWNRNCDGGHFISRAKTAVAFSRNNCWPQCKQCNRKPPQGKGGNLVKYRKTLVNMLGEHEVDLLEDCQDLIVDPTPHWYACQAYYFRQCIKVEKKRLGI